MATPLAHIVPRLPIEILGEIVRLVPTSSFCALCLVNHCFYGLAARELYEDADLLCTTPEGIDTIELICRAQQWCRTVTEIPRTAILVKSVAFELPNSRFENVTQARDLNVLMKRALEKLPNLKSLEVYCLRTPTLQSRQMLETIRISTLRDFTIVPSVDNFSATFLNNHSLSLENVIVHTENHSIGDAVAHLNLPALQYLGAPPTLWTHVHPTLTLHRAGVYAPSGAVLYRPVDTIRPLLPFSGIRSLQMVIPGHEFWKYIDTLKNEFIPHVPLEHLSFKFEEYHGLAPLNLF